MSRTRIDRFFECPRCFYLDRRLGVDRPPGFPFTLNAAVDHLLKKEFDAHRVKKTTHPLMRRYGVDAVPFQHPEIDRWRDSLCAGVEYFHPATNFLLTGGVDDVWVNLAGELIVVDYKATSKDGEVNLNAVWQDGYKRQMEFYQWLLRRNGFKVSSVGYFVYVNGRRDVEAFDGKLEFDVSLLPYSGDDSWVEGVVLAARRCLDSSSLPPAAANCDFCRYRVSADRAEAEREQ